MKSPLLLTGIGLRPPHYTEFLEKRPGVAWVEVHTDNYMIDGGRPLHVLEAVRKHYPVSLHGVNLSLGSADELNWAYLKKLRDLIQHIEPCLISEHLSWSSLNGHYFHDLFPLPYTEEALNVMVTHLRQVQDFLGRQVLIENISSYVQFAHSTMPEPVFLTEVARQSGCGILLDINNIFVTATHLGLDARHYIESIPADLVQEIHLAGYSEITINNRITLVDSHNRPVSSDVWALYRFAIQQLGRKPTIIEWDSELPALSTLYQEAAQAEQIMKEKYAAAQLTG